MTLDEAIKHARDTAENRTDLCDECRAEHKQLAEWLEQLVKLTEENERLIAENTIYSNNVERIAENYHRQGRADTIREMQERLHRRFGDDANRVFSNYNIHRYIDQIAKEMLEGNDG